MATHHCEGFFAKSIGGRQLQQEKNFSPRISTSLRSLDMLWINKNTGKL